MAVSNKNLTNLEYKGYFITTSDTVNYINRYSIRPVLLDTQSLDFLPYHPYLLKDSFEILKDVYNIEMTNPPNKFDPHIPDEFIKISEKIFKSKFKENFVITKETNKLIGCSLQIVILMNGGIFMYPKNIVTNTSKLRLLYEAKIL